MRNETFQIFLLVLIQQLENKGYKHLYEKYSNYGKIRDVWSHRNDFVKEGLLEIELNPILAMSNFYPVGKAGIKPASLARWIAYTGNATVPKLSIKSVDQAVTLFEVFDNSTSIEFLRSMVSFELTQEEWDEAFEQTKDFHILFRYCPNIEVKMHDYNNLKNLFEERYKKDNKIYRYEIEPILSLFKSHIDSTDTIMKLYKQISKFKGRVGNVKENLAQLISEQHYKEIPKLFEKEKSKRVWVSILTGIEKATNLRYGRCVSYTGGKYHSSYEPTCDDPVFLNEFFKNFDLKKLPDYQYLENIRNVITNIKDGGNITT